MCAEWINHEKFFCLIKYLPWIFTRASPSILHSASSSTSCANVRIMSDSIKAIALNYHFLWIINEVRWEVNILASSSEQCEEKENNNNFGLISISHDGAFLDEKHATECRKSLSPSPRESVLIALKFVSFNPKIYCLSSSHTHTNNFHSLTLYWIFRNLSYLTLIPTQFRKEWSVLFLPFPPARKRKTDISTLL